MTHPICHCHPRIVFHKHYMQGLKKHLSPMGLLLMHAKLSSLD